MNTENKQSKESSNKKPLIPVEVEVDAGTLVLIGAVLLLIPLIFVGFFSL